jgi:hypothetical protein
MTSDRKDDEGLEMTTANALRWYLRWLLLREIEPIGRLKQAELARRMSRAAGKVIKDSMLSQMRTDARGAGPNMADYFAAYYRKSHSEIVDEAREWYAEPRWQKWVLDEIDGIAKAKQLKLQARAKERRSISSERPSVKMKTTADDASDQEPPPVRRLLKR